jgi:hypothetical protein
MGLKEGGSCDDPERVCGVERDYRLKPVEFIKDRILPILLQLRDDFIDDLPAGRILHGDPDYYRYRCRNNWFAAFKCNLSMVVLQIREPLYTEVDEYYGFLQKGMDWQAMRTKKELELAKDILGKVIDYIGREM